MGEYLNYWLKKTVKETPNDMELGEKVREMVWKENRGDEWLVEQYNRNRSPENWVKSREEISNYIFERNPDTGEIKKRKIKY
tara:strand:+ start:86 stop:331 length:246 start_codon:yes stop_codon:yes gene_type:complete